MSSMARSGAAVERPDVVARHDELLHRYVHAATAQPDAALTALRSRSTSSSDHDR